MATDRITRITPSFMAPAFPITEDDKARLSPMLASWTKLSPQLAKLSEVDCLKVAVLEMGGSNRTLIVHRAISRFRTKRQDRENRELRNA